MSSRQWQIIFLALVAALIIGREIFGAPPSPSLWDMLGTGRN
jgi:hypothetical protein